MAGRQKRGNMAELEYAFGDNHEDIYLDDSPELVQDEPTEVDEPHEEPVVEEESAEPASVEKPDFNIWKYGRFGPEGDFMSQEHQGPQVAYINQSLGLDGDVYTKETFDAVVKYQKENKLSVSGRVDKTTYNSL